MNINSNDWIKYIKKLSMLSETAGNKMQEWIDKNGFSDINATIDYAYALVTKYGEGSSELACEMYDAIAEMEEAMVPPAEPAELPTIGETAKAINGSLKQSKEGKLINSVVQRLVKQSGADTTLKNAIRDKAQFAWVPSGDTCAFCITLASRGWQNASKKALKGGHAEHIHSHCDCQYAIRFNEKTNVEGYDPDKYKEMYYSAEGNKPQDKINSIRRMQYAEKKKDAELVVSEDTRFKDATKKWFDSFDKSERKVTYKNEITIEGNKYVVDGIHIRLDPNINEKRIANLFVDNFGGNIELWPKVTDPENIQTPDYVYRNIRMDLKTFENNGKDALYNACHKKKEQAHTFIFDISNVEMTKREALEQAEKLFKRKGTKFVERVFLVENNDIFKVLEKSEQ